MAPAFLLGGDERIPSDKFRFLQVDQSSEPQLKRRIFLLLDDGLLAAVEIDIDQQEAGFDTRNVQCQHPCRMNVECAAGVDERVPDLKTFVPIDPDFVAEIACISGSGYVHRGAADGSVRYTKILQILNIGAIGHGLQKPA